MDIISVSFNEEQYELLNKLKSKCSEYIETIKQISDLALVKPKDWDEKAVAKLYDKKTELMEFIAMCSSKLLLPTDFFDQTIKTC